MLPTQKSRAEYFIRKYGIHGIVRILQDANEGRTCAETASHFHSSQSWIVRMRELLLLQRWTMRPEVREIVQSYLEEVQNLVDKEKKAVGSLDKLDEEVRTELSTDNKIIDQTRR